MQKSKGIKIAALLCGATVAIAGIALAATHFMKGQDLYRSILIYELQGSADIVRKGAGNIKAAEDLYLESGDRLTVADGSSMRLKLDDDKYVMVEENSVLAIEAAGDEADSKTKIQLEQGSITSEIQNPLSTDSTYEVHSPNSVMAVRGTIFRVETEADEDDENYTKVSVFSGKVAMGAIGKDGSIGEVVLIDAGKEADCTGSSDSGAVLSEPAEIDYEALPLQALDFLLELSKRDAPITGATEEDLSGLVEEAKSWEEEADSEEEDEEEDVDSEEEDADIEEDTDDIDDAEDEEEDEEEDTDSPSPSNSNSGSTGTSGGTGNTGTTPSSSSGTRPSNPSTTPSNPGTSPGNPGTTPTNPGTTPSNPGTTPGNPGTTPSDPGTTPGNPGTTPGNDPIDVKPEEYTVKFMYKGEVFATQKVKSGKCAEKPVLKPEKSGKWDFDFAKEIEGDVTINWK